MACVQPFNQVEDTACRGFVQVASGFVGQQQPGIVDQRARKRHTLLLAAGELAGAMVAAIFKPTSLSQFAANAKRLALLLCRERAAAWPRFPAP